MLATFRPLAGKREGLQTIKTGWGCDGKSLGIIFPFLLVLLLHHHYHHHYHYS